MNNKSDIISSGIFLGVFLITMILVIFVDVADIGPEGTGVGLSTINGFFNSAIGYNDVFYLTSKVFGIVLFLPVAFFSLLGLYQLIKRKSLLNVDRNIIMLGVLYAITFVLYIIFDKIAINYRPVLMGNETFPEPSFPSSHTLLAIVIMLSACLNVNYYIREKNVQKIVKIILLLIALIVIVTRFLSGVHWFTDIIASIFLGFSLVLCYSGIMGKPKRRRKND